MISSFGKLHRLTQHELHTKTYIYIANNNSHFQFQSVVNFTKKYFLCNVTKINEEKTDFNQSE